MTRRLQSRSCCCLMQQQCQWLPVLNQAAQHVIKLHN
jgi:hypothetical protein